jgi:hypothetical protein
LSGATLFRQIDQLERLDHFAIKRGVLAAIHPECDQSPTDYKTSP